MAKFDKNGKDTDNFFCAQVFNKDTDLFSPDMHRFYEILLISRIISKIRLAI